jgi:hypothetical protein
MRACLTKSQQYTERDLSCRLQLEIVGKITHKKTIATEIGVPVMEIGVPVMEIGVPVMEIGVPVTEIRATGKKEQPTTATAQSYISMKQAYTQSFSYLLFPA